jgi:hypothetical protein
VFCPIGQNPYCFVTRPRQPDQTRIYSGLSALCNSLMSIESPFDFPSIPKLPRVQDFLRTSYPSVFHFGTYLSPVLSNKSTSLVLVPSTTAVLSCEAGVTTCPRHLSSQRQLRVVLYNHDWSKGSLAALPLLLTLSYTLLTEDTLPKPNFRISYPLDLVTMQYSRSPFESNNLRTESPV